MTAAEIIIKRLNPKAVVGRDPSLPGLIIGIEDVIVDNRIFRLEYRSTEDGKHANAYILYNPFGHETLDPRITHLESDGQLCLDSNSTKNTYRSPYSLERTIKRARYWCYLYTYLKESIQKHGVEEALKRVRQIEPGW